MGDFNSVSNFRMELVNEDGNAQRVTVQISGCSRELFRRLRYRTGRRLATRSALIPDCANILLNTAYGASGLQACRHSRCWIPGPRGRDRPPRHAPHGSCWKFAASWWNAALNACRVPAVRRAAERRWQCRGGSLTLYIKGPRDVEERQLTLEVRATPKI
eukprot:365740-Chlamydomonas_euryale.AAC.3